ncbi:MAG: BLUF domain-containing protein [Casimicrobium sp.]
MIRLVYVSTCAHNVQQTDVEEILRVAELRNTEQEISGMLCWSGEYFLQCLEGERSRVSRCFSNIAADKRHHSVELIVSSPTNVRWFSTWGMGFTRMMSSHWVDLPRFDGTSFNPYLIEASDLQDTFARLSSQAQRLRVDDSGVQRGNP